MMGMSRLAIAAMLIFGWESALAANRLMESIRLLESETSNLMKSYFPNGKFPEGRYIKFHPSTSWFFSHWDLAIMGALINEGSIGAKSSKADWRLVENLRLRLLRKLKPPVLQEFEQYAERYPMMGNRYGLLKYPISKMENSILQAIQKCPVAVEPEAPEAEDGETSDPDMKRDSS